ncbi:WhiB family transcriptional regulator [Streptomyces sp. GbtcB6]|uniref:WhiB family transcriptional regulator n=1 Tax=Streptomyces sp. GbtcB6 TaxID=2824751 RepID=UPI001C2F90E4
MTGRARRPVDGLAIPGFVVDAWEPVPCRERGEEFFVTGLRPSQARALCAGCGFLEACRSFALARPGLWGVWGGTTRREREAVQRGAVGRGPPASFAV